MSFNSDTECLNKINKLTNHTSLVDFMKFTGCSEREAIEIYSYLTAKLVAEMLEETEGDKDEDR